LENKPVIERSASDFLMTSAQHRQWAERARRANRHDLAFHHDQLARIIERLEQREADARSVASPPIAPAR
jgi:hypothetical protein